MTPAQQAALVALAGRAFTADETAQIDALLVTRDDVAIAAVVSVGRKRLQRMLIGAGTIVAVMGGQGGAFLDAVELLGQSDRDVFWGMDPIRRGEFDLGLVAAQGWIDRLSGKLPGFEVPLQALKSLGYADDPVNHIAVSAALNGAAQ